MDYTKIADTIKINNNMFNEFICNKTIYIFKDMKVILPNVLKYDINNDLSDRYFDNKIINDGKVSIFGNSIASTPTPDEILINNLMIDKDNYILCTPDFKFIVPKFITNLTSKIGIYIYLNEIVILLHTINDEKTYAFIIPLMKISVSIIDIDFFAKYINFFPEENRNFFQALNEILLERI